MKQKLNKEFKEFIILLRSVPGVILALFVLSVVAMNLLANKSIALPFNFLALDCGIILSWLAFLTMDILTKHFGPKASTQISIFALVVNLLMCLFLFIASVIPGLWSQSFVEGNQDVINTALNGTFANSWYVVLGSSVAFIVSAIINNFLNFFIGKLFKKNPNGFCAFICRSYLSTAVAQFVDNLTFAFLVSHFFFGWSIVQCLMCALTGMIVELLCEAVFSHIGFLVCKNWQKNNVGKEYFEYKNLQEEK